MADHHHEWRIGEEPPIIRPHSLAKHRVLEQYLVHYVNVLTANPLMPELRLTLIDGFAGGGLYRDWQTSETRLGSPLLMLQAMRQAAINAQVRRSKEFKLDAEFVFVENSPETFPFLQQTIRESEFRSLYPEKIQLVLGKFVDQVETIISLVQRRKGGGRAIFLLDQCGYLDVPLRAIRAILSSLENAEIILTFATDFLIDYLGAGRMQKTVSKLGLELSKEELACAKQQANWRFAIQKLLHRKLFIGSGAKHFTPFFIRSKDAHRDYWLIHLSNHPRARDVMVSLHWQENKSFAHYGGPGLTMLGYDQDFDSKVTGQEFFFDDNAKTRTTDALLVQLPDRIFEFPDGIPFKQLFSNVTNETPATSEIINSILKVLAKDNDIEIRDETGGIKRQAGVQHPTDIVKPAAYRSLFLSED